MRDFAVFYDPSPGPMRADHPVLVCRGRSPGGGCLFYRKTRQGNIVYACFIRIKTVAADVDFHIFQVRVTPLEIGVNNGGIPLLFGIPGIDCKIRIPGGRVNFGLFYFFQRWDFVHGFSV